MLLVLFLHSIVCHSNLKLLITIRHKNCSVLVTLQQSTLIRGKFLGCFLSRWRHLFKTPHRSPRTLQLKPRVSCKCGGVYARSTGFIFPKECFCDPNVRVVPPPFISNSVPRLSSRRNSRDQCCAANLTCSHDPLNTIAAPCSLFLSEWILLFDFTLAIELCNHTCNKQLHFRMFQHNSSTDFMYEAPKTRSERFIFTSVPELAQIISVLNVLYFDSMNSI